MPSPPFDQWVTQAAAEQALPWQLQFAQPNWQSLLTQLPPHEETAFQQWAANSKAPITDDYDMRGFWKFGGESGVNPNDGLLHFTDKYKTPLHQSFSGESLFADPAKSPPRWNERDQLIGPDGKVFFDEKTLPK